MANTIDRRKQPPLSPVADLIFNRPGPQGQPADFAPDDARRSVSRLEMLQKRYPGSFSDRYPSLPDGGRAMTVAEAQPSTSGNPRRPTFSDRPVNLGRAPDQAPVEFAARRAPSGQAWLSPQDDKAILQSITRDHPAFQYDPDSGRLGQDHYDSSSRSMTFKPLEPGFQEFMKDVELGRDSSTRPVLPSAHDLGFETELPVSDRHSPEQRATAERIEAVFAAQGRDPSTSLAIANIESRFNPTAPGSHFGAFQMDENAYAEGLRLLPNLPKRKLSQLPLDEQTAIHAAVLADRSRRFETAMHRDPEPWEQNMLWQQGVAGTLRMVTADPAELAIEVRRPGFDWRHQPRRNNPITYNLTDEDYKRFGKSGPTVGGYLDIWRKSFDASAAEVRRWRGSRGNKPR